MKKKKGTKKKNHSKVINQVNKNNKIKKKPEDKKKTIAKEKNDIVRKKSDNIKKDKLSFRRINKELKKEYKIINKTKKISKIERYYRKKEAIDNYYAVNGSKITDDILMKLYNTEFKPNIYVEIAIGTMSGCLTNQIFETIKKYSIIESSIDKILKDLNITETNMMLLINIIVRFAFIVLFIIGFVITILSVYNGISSLLTYNDKLNDYHRSVLEELIEERINSYKKKEEGLSNGK